MGALTIYEHQVVIHGYASHAPQDTVEFFSTEPHPCDDHTQINIHSLFGFSASNKKTQIPVHSGAMVPYGKNSVLYLGGITTSKEYSDKIYQFIGDEMCWKIHAKVT